VKKEVQEVFARGGEPFKGVCRSVGRLGKIGQIKEDQQGKDLEFAAMKKNAPDRRRNRRIAKYFNLKRLSKSSIEETITVKKSYY